MSDDDDQTAVLVCFRIDDMPVPNTRSRADKCASCNAGIWVAMSSPPGHVHMCMRCAEMLVADAAEAGQKIEVGSISEAQEDDILSALKAKRH